MKNFAQDLMESFREVAFGATDDDAFSLSISVAGVVSFLGSATSPAVGVGGLFGIAAAVAIYKAADCIELAVISNPEVLPNREMLYRCGQAFMVASTLACGVAAGVAFDKITNPVRLKSYVSVDLNDMQLLLQQRTHSLSVT